MIAHRYCITKEMQIWIHQEL